MRPLFSGVLFCFFLVSAEASGVLKIASWNVRNYLITDRVVDDSYRRGYPKPEIEKTALRQVLQEVDADVVLLQEMGSDPFLLELQRDLRTEGLEYAYSTVLRADDEDRHLAVLSRVPFEMLEHERELDFKYFNRREVVKRGLMELVFETEGNPWTLYNLHLKSRYTDVKEDPESAKRRTAEATVVRNVLRAELEMDPDKLFFVAGDFNDEPGSAPLRRFRQVNDAPLLQLVSLEDDRGDRWTHHFARQDRYTRVDMVLASPASSSFVIEEDSYVFDSPAVRVASDHRPVVWTVNLSTLSVEGQNNGIE